jgi:hypothetical protein
LSIVPITVTAAGSRKARSSLIKRTYTQVSDKLTPLFRDVNDHLKLVNEEVLGQRDSLAVVLQANMAVISLQGRTRSACVRTRP